jgi:hypothetical protein
VHPPGDDLLGLLVAEVRNVRDDEEVALPLETHGHARLFEDRQ